MKGEILDNNNELMGEIISMGRCLEPNNGNNNLYLEILFL
jgi:hypothetical protein